jgi:hypothetical protein
MSTNAAPTTTSTTTTSSTSTILAHLGWILAAKGDSCTATCAALSSVCHVSSQQYIDSVAEFQYALNKAGQSSAANSLTNANMCFYDESFAPAVTLPLTPKSALHNGLASSCAAVPSGDAQRLCCCSPTGCAKSAAEEPITTTSTTSTTSTTTAATSTTTTTTGVRNGFK